MSNLVIRLLHPLILVALLFLSTHAFAIAQRTFVASYGLDTNACTLTQPCRSFAVAITHTQTGGEVIVLDSAGYGPFVISQPVSVIAPAGVYAGVSVPDYQLGINVATPGLVVLEGLTLNGSSGASDGIGATEGSQLYLKRVTVSGMGLGISADNLTAEELTVRNCQGIGLAVGRTQTGISAVSIVRSRFINNSTGIAVVDYAVASVVDSEIASNFIGIQVFPGDPLFAGDSSALLTCTRCNISNSVYAGISARRGNSATVTINVIGSQLVGSNGVSQHGLLSEAGTEITVSDTLISQWAFGVDAAGGGSIVSVGDNRVYGNLFPGGFTSTIGKQ